MKLSSIISVVILVTVGCYISLRDVGTSERLCDDLTRARTLEVREELITKLATQRDRRKSLCTMVDGWGTHGVDYDLAILDYLRLNMTGSIYQVDATIASHVLQRLRDDPQLLDQVFWNHRWNDNLHFKRHIRNRKPPDGGRMSLVYRDIFMRYRSDPERFFYLITVASMVGNYDIVETLSWETLDVHWDLMDGWFRDNAAYLYFDETTGCYRIDEDARTRGIPVDKFRQEWTGPKESLPPRQGNRRG